MAVPPIDLVPSLEAPSKRSPLGPTAGPLHLGPGAFGLCWWGARGGGLLEVGASSSSEGAQDEEEEEDIMEDEREGQIDDRMAEVQSARQLAPGLEEEGHAGEEEHGQSPHAARRLARYLESTNEEPGTAALETPQEEAHQERHLAQSMLELEPLALRPPSQPELLSPRRDGEVARPDMHVAVKRTCDGSPHFGTSRLSVEGLPSFDAPQLLDNDDEGAEGGWIFPPGYHDEDVAEEEEHLRYAAPEQPQYPSPQQVQEAHRAEGLETNWLEEEAALHGVLHLIHGGALHDMYSPKEPDGQGQEMGEVEEHGGEEEQEEEAEEEKEDPEHRLPHDQRQSLQEPEPQERGKEQIEGWLGHRAEELESEGQAPDGGLWEEHAPEVPGRSPRRERERERERQTSASTVLAGLAAKEAAKDSRHNLKRERGRQSSADAASARLAAIEVEDPRHSLRRERERGRQPSADAAFGRLAAAEVVEEKGLLPGRAKPTHRTFSCQVTGSFSDSSVTSSRVVPTEEVGAYTLLVDVISGLPQSETPAVYTVRATWGDCKDLTPRARWQMEERPSRWSNTAQAEKCIVRQELQVPALRKQHVLVVSVIRRFVEAADEELIGSCSISVSDKAQLKAQAHELLDKLGEPVGATIRMKLKYFKPMDLPRDAEEDFAHGRKQALNRRFTLDSVREGVVEPAGPEPPDPGGDLADLDDEVKDWDPTTCSSAAAETGWRSSVSSTAVPSSGRSLPDTSPGSPATAAELEELADPLRDALKRAEAKHRRVTEQHISAEKAWALRRDMLHGELQDLEVEAHASPRRRDVHDGVLEAAMAELRAVVAARDEARCRARLLKEELLVAQQLALHTAPEASTASSSAVHLRALEGEVAAMHMELKAFESEEQNTLLSAASSELHRNAVIGVARDLALRAADLRTGQLALEEAQCAARAAYAQAAAEDLAAEARRAESTALAVRLDVLGTELHALQEVRAPLQHEATILAQQYEQRQVRAELLEHEFEQRKKEVTAYPGLLDLTTTTPHRLRPRSLGAYGAASRFAADWVA